MRHQIATGLLGVIAPSGFCRCPGEERHKGKTGGRDCRVLLDGAPTLFCLHASCAGKVEEINSLLRSRIAAAESGGRPLSAPRPADIAAPPVAAKRGKYPPFSAEKLARWAVRCARPVSLNWLAERSPVAVPAVSDQGRETSLLFLRSIYQPGEKVLIFSRYYSQGDFMFQPEAGGFRLADERGVAAVPSGLPADGPEGVWFLTNPVSGEWAIQPAAFGKPATWGRRHGGCVTAWRFLLLESDEAPEEDWLRCLVLLPLAIVAIFTSGGRSVHALVRVNAASKAELDAVRDVLRRVLGPLGADCAAMTAVRLARLPGTFRRGKRGSDGKFHAYPAPALQRLVWLNPGALEVPIVDIAK